MLSLLLTIFFTACIFLAFKSFKVFRMNSLHSIIVNYLTCVIAGMIYLNDQIHLISLSGGFKTWYIFSIALGFIFIYTFFRMSRTAQEISVSASSMASKLAMVIPIIFSIVILQRTAKAYDFINYLGIILTIPALLLASWPDKDNINKKLLSSLWLPISVFILSGIIDTSLNFFNAIYEDDASFIFFPVFVFFIAGIVGLSYSLFFDKTGSKWELKSVIGGVYLGIPNFFSLFFLLETLKLFNQDGAFIFPFTNLGTILLSALGAYFLFREKLNKMQLTGIVLAIISLIFLAHQEFFIFF